VIVDVELDLEGEPRQITAVSLHSALGELLELLREAAEAADIERQQWRIDDLRMASAHIAVAAPEGPSVANFVQRGLDGLRQRAAIPDGWTRQMVKRVLDLGQIVGSGGTTGLRLRLSRGGEPRVFDAVLVDHAERALGGATATLGSLRGRVDRWNEHGRREIGLSRLDGPPVPATYSTRLSPRILAEAVGNEIEAWGTVRRNVVGQVTGMTIDDFAVVQRTREIIPASSLAGVFATGDFALEDWLRDRHANE
jgi:hypothetical protein